jgi:hypothetical protein
MARPHFIYMTHTTSYGHTPYLSNYFLRDVHNYCTTQVLKVKLRTTICAHDNYTNKYHFYYFNKVYISR